MKRERFNHAWFYRLLLKLYPARFREEYQIPMERQFFDEYRDAGTGRERSRLWMAAVLDVARQAPAQFASEAWNDLRYTLRVYRSGSTSGALAAGALALAIGASTGVFGVVSAVLLRSLPFNDPEELVEIRQAPVTPFQGRAAFLAWSAESHYLQGAAAFSTTEMNLSRNQGALRVKAAETTANLFELLGTRTVRGRSFASEEGSPGRTGVAVIGYDLWQQAFGGDPGVLGMKIGVNGTPVEVIGVAPPRFDYPEGTMLWLPSAFDFELVPKRGALFFRTIGRLSVPYKNAVEMFEAEVSRIAPSSLKETGENRPGLIGLQRRLAGPVHDALWVLAGLVTFVLLAACANVAQLLLSRASERRQEFATRAALGASRARLIQQLVTEALALTACSTALGLLVAHYVCMLASLIAPAQLATQQYTIFDWRVASFAAGLAALIGVVFGVLPILTSWHKTDDAIRGRTATGSRDAVRVRWGLMALQAGLTLTLAAGSLSIGRAFLRLLETDLGFTPANSVTMNVSVYGTRHDGNAARRYYAEVLERLRTTTGVEAAGAVGYLPLATRSFVAGSFKLDSGQLLNGIQTNGSSPDYFRAMDTPFVAGRDFRPGESSRVVIVNEAFAEMAGLAGSIVGRRLFGPWTADPYEIVGVVRTARFAGPSHPGGPMVYWRFDEESPPALTFVARVRGDPERALTVLRDAVRSVDPVVPVYDVKTLERRLSDTLARPKFYTQATLFLGGLAALVAVAGIYGSAARSVAQKRREMGIRMAIGATSRQIRTLVLRETIAPVILGIGIGIGGALATGRYLEHLIADTGPVTPEVCMAAAALLLIVAAAAAWRATARVLSIDPAEAVRVDLQ